MAKSSSSQLQKPTSTAIAAPIQPDDWRQFFRIVTARQNHLSEIFPDPAFVGLNDIDELHLALQQKLSSYTLLQNSFTCIASFNKLRTQQSSSWAEFKRVNWKIPEVIESLTLRWEFVVHFPERPKPCPFTVTVRCASTIHPQEMLQFMLSRDEEEIDSMQLKAATMSCKVDFSDPLISQELLDIVARWVKARRRPEGKLPGIKWCCERSEKIATVIRVATPLVTFATLIAYYYRRASSVDSSLPATAGFLSFSLIWLSSSVVAFSLSGIISRWLGSFAERHLDSMLRFHVFELTSGDMNRQTKLAGETSRSFWKFAGSGLVSVVWNIVAAYLCVKYLALN